MTDFILKSYFKMRLHVSISQTKAGYLRDKKRSLCQFQRTNIFLSRKDFITGQFLFILIICGFVNSKTISKKEILKLNFRICFSIRPLKT